MCALNLQITWLCRKHTETAHISSPSAFLLSSLCTSAFPLHIGAAFFFSCFKHRCHQLHIYLQSSFAAGALDSIGHLVQLVKFYGGKERGVLWGFHWGAFFHRVGLKGREKQEAFIKVRKIIIHIIPCFLNNSFWNHFQKNILFYLLSKFDSAPYSIKIINCKNYDVSLE